MKISHIIPRKWLGKMVEKRNARRIKEYVSISPELAPEKAEKVREISDHMARFAQKNNCSLEFTPGKDLFESSTQMNVYKRGVGIIENESSQPDIDFVFTTQTLSGSASVPEDISDRKSLMQKLKDSITTIIKNDKTWDDKLTEYGPSKI